MDARNSEIKSHFQLLIIIIILIYRFSHFYILYTSKNRDIDSHYKPFNSLLYTPPKYYLPRVNMFHESSIKIDTFFSKVFVCWIIALKISRIIFTYVSKIRHKLSIIPPRYSHLHIINLLKNLEKSLHQMVIFLTNSLTCIAAPLWLVLHCCRRVWMPSLSMLCWAARPELECESEPTEGDRGPGILSIKS